MTNFHHSQVYYNYSLTSFDLQYLHMWWTIGTRMLWILKVQQLRFWLYVKRSCDLNHCRSSSLASLIKIAFNTLNILASSSNEIEEHTIEESLNRKCVVLLTAASAETARRSPASWLIRHQRNTSAAPRLSAVTDCSYGRNSNIWCFLLIRLSMHWFH